MSELSCTYSFSSLVKLIIESSRNSSKSIIDLTYESRDNNTWISSTALNHNFQVYKRSHIIIFITTDFIACSWKFNITRVVTCNIGWFDERIYEHGTQVAVAYLPDYNEKIKIRHNVIPAHRSFYVCFYCRDVEPCLSKSWWPQANSSSHLEICTFHAISSS